MNRSLANPLTCLTNGHPVCDSRERRELTQLPQRQTLRAPLHPPPVHTKSVCDLVDRQSRSPDWCTKPSPPLTLSEAL